MNKRAKVGKNMPTGQKLTGSAAQLSRRAIADFIESNTPRLNKWLSKVAEGVPKVNSAGDVLRDADGSVRWVVPPNYSQAIKLVAEICEYHLPKLSRADVAVAAQVEHNHSAADLKSLSTDELKLMILRSAGVDSIDVIEQTLEPMPEWLENAPD